MAEWETIQERRISGKGVLQVPTDVVKNRAFILFATVIREPKNKYANYNYNPPKGRYATLTFLRQGYVLDVRPMEYSMQVWDGVNDVSGQTLIAVKCAYEGILQTFYNLSLALGETPGGQGLTPLAITDLIKNYENLRLAWDEIRVQCYADTAISLRLDRLKYDVCDIEKDKDKPPPPPPEPEPPIPPGTPIQDLSPPYKEGDDLEGDDGNTNPFPGDTPPPPPNPAPDGLYLEVTVVFMQRGFPDPITYKKLTHAPYYVEHHDGLIRLIGSTPGKPYTEDYFIIGAGRGQTPPGCQLISVSDSGGYDPDIRALP